MALMDRLLRVGEGKLLKQLKGMANQVNAIEDDFIAMDDDELRGQTADFRARVEKGETLESLLSQVENGRYHCNQKLLYNLVRHYPAADVLWVLQGAAATGRPEPTVLLARQRRRAARPRPCGWGRSASRKVWDVPLDEQGVRV